MRPPLWVVLAAACGSTTMAPGQPQPDGGGGGAPPLDSVELGPAPGWPSSVAVRSVPQTFRTSITEIAAGASGTVWLLRDEIAQPSELPGTPVLERYAANGPLLRRITFAPHALVSSFVVHPSGQISVLVMRDDDGDTLKYELEILRLSAEGDAVADVRFGEMPGPRENLYYDATGAHELAANVPFNLAWTSHVVALPDDDGLFLLAEWTYSFKLYRLDAAYEKVWGAQVMPANLGDAFQFSPSLLARSEDGSVYVGTQLFEDDAPIYGEHFGRPALVPNGSYDTLVQRFDASGTFSGVRLFGGPAVDHASAMTVHDGTVLLAGAARISKHTDANRTMEWDVMLGRARLEDAAPEDYRALDLSRDDFAWALADAPGGSLVLGGSTDYVQVDTNSQVEDGKGLLLTVSADLTEEAAVELSGPRDVQVRAMVRLPDGKILFAGTRDGPLTHTDPSMTENDGVWGVLQ